MSVTSPVDVSNQFHEIPHELGECRPSIYVHWCTDRWICGDKTGFKWDLGPKTFGSPRPFLCGECSSELCDL